MKPIASLPPDVARGLGGLFFDLDDTVLTHGVLGRAAYGALWDLHESGLRLVAVTGRPSGWAEILVRQWPIDAAIAENGAVFVVRDDKNAVRVLADGTDAEVAERRGRLEELVRDVRVAMPALSLADDNAARRSDVAWDIGERVTVPEEEISALAARVLSAGARMTRSTVHLHASFERDDKASGAIRFVRTQLHEDPGAALYRWAFVGDSPNDAACFSAFATTFGVANVRRFLGKLSVPPRYVASAERGDGFAEITRALLGARVA